MFKNILIYRFKLAAQLSQFTQNLHAQVFEPTRLTQEHSTGWVPPRGIEHGALMEVIGGQAVLKLMTETRAVPASAIKDKAEERLAQIEATTGRKPGKKERKEIAEDAKLGLLPHAFPKRAATTIWLDEATGLLVLDAGSLARADDAITALVGAFEGLQITQVNTDFSPQAAMASWLARQEPPQAFSIDRECELKAADESKSVVKFSRHALDTDEVRDHIQAGKLPTKLAMTWDGRVSFVLTESLQLKKVEFLDGVFDGTSQEKEDAFDADVAIATGELCNMIPVLINALGGEMAAVTEAA